jgi:predicted nucleotidyltransferase
VRRASIGFIWIVRAQRANTRSDVDLLVEFQPGRKTIDNFMVLADLLESVLHRRVELVTAEGLSPYLGPRILLDVENVPLDD